MIAIVKLFRGIVSIFYHGNTLVEVVSIPVAVADLEGFILIVSIAGDPETTGQIVG